MILILIIYLLGVIATGVLLYCSLEKGYEVTVENLITAFLLCVLSWLAFPFILGYMFSDYVVFRKK